VLPVEQFAAERMQSQAGRGGWRFMVKVVKVVKVQKVV
jgi:hypothetical protein